MENKRFFWIYFFLSPGLLLATDPEDFQWTNCLTFNNNTEEWMSWLISDYTESAPQQEADQEEQRALYLDAKTNSPIKRQGEGHDAESTDVDEQEFIFFYNNNNNNNNNNRNHSIEEEERDTSSLKRSRSVYENNYEIDGSVPYTEPWMDLASSLQASQIRRINESTPTKHTTEEDLFDLDIDLQEVLIAAIKTDEDEETNESNSSIELLNDEALEAKHQKEAISEALLDDKILANRGNEDTDTGQNKDEEIEKALFFIYSDSDTPLADAPSLEGNNESDNIYFPQENLNLNFFSNEQFIVFIQEIAMIHHNLLIVIKENEAKANPDLIAHISKIFNEITDFLESRREVRINFFDAAQLLTHWVLKLCYSPKTVKVKLESIIRLLKTQQLSYETLLDYVYFFKDIIVGRLLQAQYITGNGFQPLDCYNRPVRRFVHNIFQERIGQAAWSGQLKMAKKAEQPLSPYVDMKQNALWDILKAVFPKRGRQKNKNSLLKA